MPRCAAMGFCNKISSPSACCPLDVADDELVLGEEAFGEAGGLGVKFCPRWRQGAVCIAYGGEDYRNIYMRRTQSVPVFVEVPSAADRWLCCPFMCVPFRAGRLMDLKTVTSPGRWDSFRAARGCALQYMCLDDAREQSSPGRASCQASSSNSC